MIEVEAGLLGVETTEIGEGIIAIVTTKIKEEEEEGMIGGGLVEGEEIGTDPSVEMAEDDMAGERKPDGP